MWNKYKNNETMEVISSFGIRKTMYLNGKKENYKVLEFYLNNSSCFETSASLYYASSANKRPTLTLKIK